MLFAGLSSAVLRRNATGSVFAFFHLRRLGGLLFFSRTTTATSANAAEGPSLGPHFMADYLIASCGFLAAEASKVSKRLAHVKSPQNPDLVLDFLRSHGFNGARLRKLVTSIPTLLCCNVEKTLVPKIKVLHDLGLSQAEVTQLMFSNPFIFYFNSHRTLLPKIQFWKNLLSSTEIMTKFFTRNQWVLGVSFENKILPNLTLLRDCGIADKRISMAVKKHSSIITHRPEYLRALVDRVEELGVPRQSGMFLWALQITCSMSIARFKAKKELMKSLGWSEAEFLVAFRRAPIFLDVSAKEMLKKMEFLVQEVGYKPSDLALRPHLLMYSLEKRLIPRYRALEFLKSKGLIRRERRLHNIIHLSEKTFFEKFILCHKEQVPELHEMFTAACKGGAS